MYSSKLIVQFYEVVYSPLEQRWVFEVTVMTFRFQSQQGVSRCGAQVVNTVFHGVRCVEAHSCTVFLRPGVQFSLRRSDLHLQLIPNLWQH
jgi:hypothetical protein